ncbi:hypothetical protein GA0070616_4629 [Micromonospora nigra]|uniref:Uncharacterized protein n=1 Tax=Micromonospora nigra TaxID=145857 RepID=A0A1C6SUM2_9ACTN|nr:hypothetical protein [Micromonospora nigra]SCL33079.1 hypothetical protein GA0070616_4629 [Micromonospora nigra]
MTQVFDHADSCGDRLVIQRPAGRALFALVRPRFGASSVGVHLTPADVDRLRDALAPHGARRAASAAVADGSAVLDYVDPDDDTLTVYTRTNPGEPLQLVINADEDNAPAVNLTPDGVTRLRAALKAFDPAEADPVPAADPGRLYTLPAVTTVGQFDPARVAALDKAREYVKPGSDTYDLVRVAEFLAGTES